MKKLTVKCGNKVYSIHPDDIIFLEGNGRYTNIHTQTDKLTECKNLGEYEKMLPTPPFVRIHKGYMVNIMNFVFFERGGSLVLKNGMSFPLSDTYKDNVREIIGKWQFPGNSISEE